jgi:hypothetical protein
MKIVRLALVKAIVALKTAIPSLSAAKQQQKMQRTTPQTPQAA